MTGEERKALTFVAILLGLSAVARAVNRPDPVVLAGASTIPIQARLEQNQQVRQRVSKPGKTAAARKKAKPEPAWRRPGHGVIIDNRPPKGGAPTPINLNRATAAELDALPGISPTVAQRIVEYRTAKGTFSSVEELDSVKGIGPAVLAKVRPLVKLR